METAGLYAFARAHGRKVLCFAHVTNQMGQAGDFEKGEADGAIDALAVLTVAARRLLGPTTPPEAATRAGGLTEGGDRP